MAHIEARGGSCLLSELGGTSAWKQATGEWKQAKTYRGSLQSFLEARRHIFILDRRKKTVRSSDAAQPKSATSLNGLQKGTSLDSLQSSLSPSQREERRVEVVTNFVEHLASSPTGSCDMQELAMLPAWLQGGIGMGKLKSFLERQSDSFEVLDQGNGRSNIRLKYSAYPLPLGGA